ncbi:MAG: hypothetical protein IH987_16465 [Planctomycetes bacterium]|nr:hypothetical protein [Planctomycetota bacterium]
MEFVGYQIEESRKEAPASDPDVPAKQAPAKAQPNVPSEAPDIDVEFTEFGIVIRSDDLDALDAFEYLLLAAINRRGTMTTTPTIYYLRYASAQNAVGIVEQVLGIGGGGGDGLLGGLAGNFLGGAAGDIVGSLLGGGGGGGTVETSGDVRLTAEPRLNGVIVQANAQDLELIKSILAEIDQSFAPQGWNRTYFIPIHYLDADEVAGVIRETFSENFASATQGQQQSQQRQAQQFFQQLMGGRGGRGGRGGSQQQQQPERMTLTVHARSNSILVTGPEHLALRVKSLVEAIDQKELLDQEAIAVVKLRGNVKSETMSEAMLTMFGESISTSSTSSTSSTQPGQPARTDAGSLQQRAEFFRAIQQLRGGQGRPGGGGRPGGAGPGGGRPGGGGPGGGRPGGGGPRGGR